MLSDHDQTVTLVRFFGEEARHCFKLRLGSGASGKQEASFLLGHLQILIYWKLCSHLVRGIPRKKRSGNDQSSKCGPQGSLLRCLMLMKNAVSSNNGASSRSPPRSQQASPKQRPAISLAVRGRFQQILLYVPTFGEGRFF